jgi:hypothetical protein
MMFWIAAAVPRGGLPFCSIFADFVHLRYTICAL